MDGSKYTERFRDMEQPLASMFRTICTEKIEERGYLIYCFELKPQKQVKIQSCEDIYCDPKNDDDMRAYMQNHSWVIYVTKEREMAKVIRETEEEIRLREKDLKDIGIQEAVWRKREQGIMRRQYIQNLPQMTG